MLFSSMLVVAMVTLLTVCRYGVEPRENRGNTRLPEKQYPKLSTVGGNMGLQLLHISTYYKHHVLNPHEPLEPMLRGFSMCYNRPSSGV